MSTINSRTPPPFFFLSEEMRGKRRNTSAREREIEFICCLLSTINRERLTSLFLSDDTMMEAMPANPYGLNVGLACSIAGHVQ